MKYLLKRNISFTYNEALELIISMGMIACEEQMLALAEDYKLELDPLAMSFHEEARTRLSPHTLRELEFFFKYNFLHKGLDFAFYESICSSMEPLSAEEWMMRLEQSPAERIVAEMVYGVYHDKMDELLQGMDWEVVKGNIPLLLEIAKKTKPQPEVVKAHVPLLECLAHPEETKVRCLQLIQQFYHDAFSLWKDRLRVESERATIRYDELFHDNPERFIRDHTGTEPIIYDIPTTFHISLMGQVGSNRQVFYTGTSWIGWVIFGIHNDRVFGPAADREKTELFLKTFSDKRRLDILLLLRERPHYGQEIATKLSITPSAVNYHANFLFFLNLLEMKRIEHRMYYHLDIEKLRGLLAVTTRVMLDEDY
jgi:DNA-binding transcriptional ArsR family regulator